MGKTNAQLKSDLNSANLLVGEGTKTINEFRSVIEDLREQIKSSKEENVEVNGKLFDLSVTNCSLKAKNIELEDTITEITVDLVILQRDPTGQGEIDVLKGMLRKVEDAIKGF